jgi:hypothetical protein
MRLLLQLLEERSPLDHALVSAIAQMPDVLPSAEVLPHLRGCLQSEAPGVARETVTALGFFRDAESVETLIEMLAEAPDGIRGNAHWALKHISGLEFPDDAVRWRVWCTGEKQWWETVGKRELAALSSGDKDRILTALRLLGRGRLFRDRIRPAVEPLLENGDPEIRAAAEELLRMLGFRRKAAPPSISGALAAQGFIPVPPEQLEVWEAPISLPPASPESTSIVPLVGMSVLVLLMFRIFGPGAIARFRKLWNSEDRHVGAVSVKLKPKRRRRRPGSVTR